jgi:hypothetical protein
VKVELIGRESLVRRVLAIANSPYEEDTAKALGAAAAQLARTVRSLAPVRTGRLRTATIGRAWTQSADARRRYGPGAFAQTNLKPRYVNTAPYGHIVEERRHMWQRGIEQGGQLALDQAAAKIHQIQQRILSGT